MIIRRRRLKLNQIEKLVPIKTKFEKREKNRERKALKAANLEIAIEKELLNNLKQGVYPKEIYNLDHQNFEQALKEHEMEDEKEYEMDELSDVEEEESEDEREIVDENMDDIDDLEDFDEANPDGKEAPAKRAIEIEYENEYEMDQQNTY
jgi:protein MAK16